MALSYQQLLEFEKGLSGYDPEFTFVFVSDNPNIQNHTF